MYHITERNERRNRQSAFWLAVTLHIALGAFIYLQAGDKPTPKSDLSATTTKTYPSKTRPLAQP